MAKSLIKYRNEQTVLASAINESSVEDKSHFSTIWNGHRDVVVGNKSATVFSVTSQSNAGKKFYVLPQNDEDTFSHGETFRYKNSQMVINGKTQKFKNRTCYEAEKYNLKERFGKNDSHT